jgi:hypothetical protein
MKMERSANPLAYIVQGLVYLYILTIPFQTLGFKFMGLAIGLPEIVFFVLGPLATIRIISSRQKLCVDKLDLFVFGWLLANILAGWHSGFDSVVVSEIIKTAYLVMLYMILKWTISPEIIKRIVKVIILSSLIAALTGIIGLMLEYNSIETFLAIKRPYPYLVQVIQAKGFTPSPNMLASIVMVGILFQTNKILNNKIFKVYDALILIILLTGIILTFSKTISLLIPGIILIWDSKKQQQLLPFYHILIRTVVIGFVIIYVFATHILIVSNNQNLEILSEEKYIAGAPILETDHFRFYSTQYTQLKKISIHGIVQSFPWGLGAGKFNNFAHKLKEKYPYRTHVPYPDPHSTYLGIFAELGVAGFFLLLAFFSTIGLNVHKMSMEMKQHSSLIIILGICFIIISLDAINTDIMNFRHYWILVSITEVLGKYGRTEYKLSK